MHTGALLFNSHCFTCHGLNAVAGPLPDLRYSTKETLDSFPGVVLAGARVSDGMPAFGKILSAKDVEAILAYVIAQLRKRQSRRRLRNEGRGAIPCAPGCARARAAPAISVRVVRILDTILRRPAFCPDGVSSPALCCREFAAHFEAPGEAVRPCPADVAMGLMLYDIVFRSRRADHGWQRLPRSQLVRAFLVR